jgi:cyclophilin family peptidyl-prolyl cis-trans isomerase
METVPMPERAGGATEEAQVPKQYSSAPAMQIDVNKQYTATLETNKGTIVAQLYPKDAPVTVNNFVFLAREGYYNGIIFHRIIPGFVIQGGDPTGTGSGGPGYQFEDELGSTQRPYETGSLAMANAGPNSNGSQFFIVLEGGGRNLGPLYNHFGKVTSGMEVVNEIASTPTGAGDRPQETVRIETITIAEQ